MSNYWIERAEALELEREILLKKALRTSTGHYQHALREIDKEIKAFYAQYAGENGVSLHEATKALTGKELSQTIGVEKYTAMAKAGQDVKGLGLKARVSRLDALKFQINEHINALGKAESAHLTKFLGATYEDTYYKNIFEVFKGEGVGSSFNQLDNRKIKIALNKPWSVPEDNFSSRIWTNKARLQATLDKELTRATITGRNVEEVVKDVAKTMDTSLYNASRLVQTEEAHMANMARDECYQEMGVDQYQIVCTLDERTCPICGDFDGKVFNNADRVEGVNSPPFHPNCRCTDAPYYSTLKKSGRVARGKDKKTYQLDEHMTYNEWIKTI